jgi:hypothetical protein
MVEQRDGVREEEGRAEVVFILCVLSLCTDAYFFFNFLLFSPEELKILSLIRASENLQPFLFACACVIVNLSLI